MCRNFVKQILSQNKERRIYDVRVKEILNTSIWWQDLGKEVTLNTDDIPTNFTVYCKIYHKRNTNLKKELNITSIVKPRNLETL